jgi:hypothetical protein
MSVRETSGRFAPIRVVPQKYSFCPGISGAKAFFIPEKPDPKPENGFEKSIWEN